MAGVSDMICRIIKKNSLGGWNPLPGDIAQQDGVCNNVHHDYSLRRRPLIAVVKEAFKGRSEKVQPNQTRFSFENWPRFIGISASDYAQCKRNPSISEMKTAMKPVFRSILTASTSPMLNFASSPPLFSTSAL